MAKLINGKEISQQIKDELKEKVSALKAQGKNICLAVIQVGNDPRISASSHVRLNFRRRQPRKNFSLLSRI